MDMRALLALALIASSALGAENSTRFGVGTTIEAEALRADRSAGYAITQHGSDRFLQFIDRGSHLCYDGVDLSGVKSIEYRYAKGDGEPPRRFAVVAFAGRDFDSATRINLGERITTLTGGWETFRTERIGLSQQLTGLHRLCIIGMEGGGVFNLDRLTLSDQPGRNDGITIDYQMPIEARSAAGERFRLEKVAEVSGELWSMDFLDQDTVIAAEKSGNLWRFDNGKRSGPITGTPQVRFVGQGGLHSVKAHPDYHNNGWIYLSFADPTPQGSMTAIVRGRIRDNRWVDQQVIYKAAPAFYLNSEAHYGSRLAFKGDYLYFSVGDRLQQDQAQDLTSPYGKIHRIFADGRIPKDNPFVARPGAVPTIWSYGHRNPQGLTMHPQTGEVWATEHGPRGGDELNLIIKGANYGWPAVTFGTNYDGTIVSTETQRDGMEPPRTHWTPSIGVSALTFYNGPRFATWRNQLLVGSLAYQELRLVHIESGKVTREDPVLQGMGRIRDVMLGPDGTPYVVLNFPNGMILRLVAFDRT
ncbi:PQQ-dependent sugar dehydrogenase [Steroidobacter cummioxidans]|uniref:PQQ-dependent sugar dehydrogenase n=1 Tax=Steroidobacter cummioxidans TaxID=1803913 RepID=UPI000E30C881|nr:PQQ-dependent sugar dehydrogenase [Steroidobacter cummioxidans]